MTSRSPPHWWEAPTPVDARNRAARHLKRQERHLGGSQAPFQRLTHSPLRTVGRTENERYTEASGAARG